MATLFSSNCGFGKIPSSWRAQSLAWQRQHAQWFRGLLKSNKDGMRYMRDSRMRNIEVVLEKLNGLMFVQIGKGCMKQAKGLQDEEQCGSKDDNW